MMKLILRLLLIGLMIVLLGRLSGILWPVCKEGILSISIRLIDIRRPKMKCLDIAQVIVI